MPSWSQTFEVIETIDNNSSPKVLVDIERVFIAYQCNIIHYMKRFYMKCILVSKISAWLLTENQAFLFHKILSAQTGALKIALNGIVQIGLMNF